MGLFSRSEREQSTVQFDTPHTQQAYDAPGQLLQITPFKESTGLAAARRFWRTLHDAQTSAFRSKNISDRRAFELWFTDGTIKFYLWAVDDSTARSYIKRVEACFENAEVHAVEGLGFPPIEPGNHVAAAELDFEKHHFYPIRDGFEYDPYGDITSEMLSTPDTHVIIQIVARPVSPSWTNDAGDGGLFRSGTSVTAMADYLREGRVKGWLNPQPVDPSKKDREQAKCLEDQDGKRAYDTSLRVVAIAPDEREAVERCQATGEMFARQYRSAVSEQQFTVSPVAESSVAPVVDACHQRELMDSDVVLTIDELAAVAHLPSGEITTPNIGWKNTQRGTQIPAAVSQPEVDNDGV
ncbi:hypothetical protein [Halocatena halophila]|uniref:hypothetical protein n=1 Tax=Halocatena halophila TaxID=2814576 RepID=UPI002ED0B4EA